MDYRFVFPVREKLITADIVGAFAEVAAALAQAKNLAIPELAAVKSSRTAQTMAEQLQKAGKKSAIFIGEYALSHPQAAHIRALARLISEHTGAAVGILTEGANSPGAWIAGAVPHRGPGGAHITQPGADAQALLSSQPKRAYFLLGLEPEMDCLAPAAAVATLRQAGLVVCLASFMTAAMEEYADFILPVAPVTETAGTFVNIAGTVQSFSAISVPAGESRPAWKIFRVLANFMELPGFEYSDIHEVQAELRTIIEQAAAVVPVAAKTPFIPGLEAENLHLTRLAPWPLYRVDPMVRRATALQDTLRGGKLASIAIHSTLAEKLKLAPGQRVTARQGDSQVTLPLRIDDRLARNVVLVPSALAETAGFGQACAPITLQREAANG